MPTAAIPIANLISQSNWTPIPGTYNNGPDYIADLAARGSGLYVQNSAGSNANMVFDLDTSSIPSGATIITVELVTSVKGSGGTPAPYIDGLGLQASPAHFNTGQVFIGGGFGDVTAIYPHPLTFLELSTSWIELGADNLAGSIQSEFLGCNVTYSTTPIDSVMVWTAGAYPPGCSTPPIERFEPFGLFPASAGLLQMVSIEYARTYGRPPVGSVIWSYYRTISPDLLPDPASPLVSFAVPADL